MCCYVSKSPDQLTCFDESWHGFLPFAKTLCKRTVLFVFLAALCQPFSLLADTLYLRNGNIVTGNIINQTPESVVMMMDDHRKKKIRKNTIQRIQFRKERSFEEKLKDNAGDNARGNTGSKIVSVDESASAPVEKRGEERGRIRSSDLRALLRNEDTLWDRMHWENEKHDESDSFSEGEEAMVLSPSVGDRGSFLWNSALIPGWGQMRAGDTIRGTVYTPLILTGLGSASGAFRTWKSARNQLNSTNRMNTLLLVSGKATPLTSFYFNNQARASRGIANQKNSEIIGATAFAGIVYLINLVDAAFFSKEPHSLARGGGERKEGVTIESYTVQLETQDSLRISAESRDFRVDVRYSISF